MIEKGSRRRRTGVGVRGVGFALVLAAATPVATYAQWSTTYEQFYLQAKHNWEFRNRYQAADRLFNAFDFGHAILYETLWSKPGAPVTELEEKWYDRLTEKILVNPPRVPLEESAIEIAYARLAPEAKAMFDWAHILHRQIYDVWADERLSTEQKDAEVAKLVAYYKTRRDLAFSSKPKTMELMQEQPYSLAFRQNYPKFNGLIWAYHWLQIGLYEPLLVNNTTEARQAGVRATVARFWQMLREPPSAMPHVMPMAAAVAPTFATRYPEAAAIFDNLHSMHDVVSDILANPSVPRNRKRQELMLAAERFRDDTSYVMTIEAWRTMAQHMGVENMGGPATSFLPELPTPTVTYGAVMTHDDRTGEMTGFKYGSATGGAHAGMQHAGGARDSAKAAPVDHAAMGHAAAAKDTAAERARPEAAYGAVDTSGTSMDPHMEQMMMLYTRLLADSVMRRRMMADTAAHRIIMETIDQMPAEREHLRELMEAAHAEDAKAAAERPRTRSTPRRQPAKPASKPAAAKPVAKPAPKPADPHAGHRPPR